MKILRELIEGFRADAKTKDIPRVSGIYQIRCIPSGKIYVGSAVNLQERWRHHKSALRHNRHVNAYLQAAWEKHGENNFEFVVLEIVNDKSNLFAKEQEWIDMTESADRERGFNIFDTVDSPGAAFAQIWDGFIDPKGNEVVITNLEEFCRENGLERSTMWRLAKGTYKHKTHKGWTHQNSISKRPYEKIWEGFFYPDGSSVGSIKNLAAFCREHNLDDTHMIALAKGKLHMHKGFTHANKREHLGYKTYTGFINPEGQRVVIANLQDFCRRNNLHAVHMHQLINGQRKSHHGWTWRPENENE